MERSGIIFRKAGKEDVSFVAQAVLAAVDAGDFNSVQDDERKKTLDVLNGIICLEGTLYSLKNVLIAEVEGERAGCIIAYDGARYKALKEKTFNLLKEGLGLDFTGMDDEAGRGEYYLDSLAVSPRFRKRGIGRLLIMQALETGEALGFSKASLLVLRSDKGLRGLYSSLGFVAEGKRMCFGKEYTRMTIPLH